MSSGYAHGKPEMLETTIQRPLHGVLQSFVEQVGADMGMSSGYAHGKCKMVERANQQPSHDVLQRLCQAVRSTCGHELRGLTWQTSDSLHNYPTSFVWGVAEALQSGL